MQAPSASPPTIPTVPERAQLEAVHGLDNVWDTDQATERFSFVYFAAPFVRVIEKATGRAGWLEFIAWPRLYFDFKEDSQ